MKNIKTLTFFSLFLFVSLKILAQELRQDIYDDRQNLITKTCTDFKHLVDGFDFVLKKYPVGVSFANFLEENLSHDEQEANYCEVLSDAQDFICESVKEPFLDIFNQACARPDQLREEPLWKYVVAHKDGFMRLSICEWMNVRTQDFDTKLHDAVSKNDLSKVDMLLRWHCNPNVKNKDGLFPLHIAVKNKS